MSNERHARSCLNSGKSWVVYQSGESQFAHQRPTLNNHNFNASRSSSKVEYRDTAFWGKNKMTYEELTSAWDAFNRSEEVKALYFTQSEAVDRLLDQVFQNVRIDCEDLDGFKPVSCKSNLSSNFGRKANPSRRKGCACKSDHLSGTECVTFTEPYDGPEVDQLTIPPSSPQNGVDTYSFVNSTGISRNTDTHTPSPSHHT